MENIDKTVLKFRVELEEFNNLIWREIVISSKSSLADLAYTILASFETLGNHLYHINHLSERYECFFTDYSKEDALLASSATLYELMLSIEDKITMYYDYGADWVINIKLLSIEDKLDKNYPIITDGLGKGIPEDIISLVLEDIIIGTHKHWYTDINDNYKEWVYNDYSIKKDNKNLHKVISLFKKGYEKSN